MQTHLADEEGEGRVVGRVSDGVDAVVLRGSAVGEVELVIDRELLQASSDPLALRSVEGAVVFAGVVLP